jgi:outer membrane receptor for ferrienterochelin and colicin
MCFPFPPAAQEPAQVEPVRTSITVVEKISAETPASVSVLDSTALQQIPGADLDDRCATFPGSACSAAAENALDRQFYVAFTPTPNTGAPRLWRLGLRWDGRLW